MANFVTPQKTAGSGTETITLTISAHTGRNPRTCSLIVKNSNGSKPSKTVSITEEAATFTASLITASLSASTGNDENLSFQFKTNAKSFRFDLAKLNGIGVTISSVKLGTATITPLSEIYTIPDDPGVESEITLTVAIAVAKNGAPSSKSGNIGITCSGNAGQTDVSLSLPITQAAGTSTLSVTPESLTIPATGGTKTITITSNDEWTISIQ